MRYTFLTVKHRISKCLLKEMKQTGSDIEKNNLECVQRNINHILKTDPDYKHCVAEKQLICYMADTPESFQKYKEFWER